jgi:hypothetical protein
MKNIFLILCILLSFINCSNNNIGNNENSIIGTWSLLKFEPGFSPTENFNNGDIIWIFQQNGTVNITIDISISSSPIKQSGSYNYSLTERRILIGDTEYDYEFNKSILVISDNPSADGFRAEFSKNQ